MTAPTLLGPSPVGGGPAPAPAWEETSAEAARADDRYWDSIYDTDDEE